jgi:hypothetical protein
MGRFLYGVCTLTPELSGVLFGETPASTAKRTPSVSFDIRGESCVCTPYLDFLLSPSHLGIVELITQDDRILLLTLVMSIIVKSEVAATLVGQS